MKPVYSLFVTVLISITSFAQNEEETLQRKLHHHHLVCKWDDNEKFNTQLRQWITDHPLPGIYERGIEDLPRTGALLEGMHFIGYNNPGKKYFYHFMSVVCDQKNKE